MTWAPETPVREDADRRSDGFSRPDMLLVSDLKRGLRLAGCPLCRLLRNADLHYLRVFLREGKDDGRMLLRLLGSWGLCARHAGALVHLEPVESGDGLGTGTLYGWLLDDLGPDFIPTSPCPGCEAAEAYERGSLAALRDLLHPVSGDADLRRRFEDGAGLCLGHFVAAAPVMQDDESLRILTDVQARAWAVLSEDLKEYLRKHDYRFSHEPKTPAEEHSWVRAVAAISGAAAEPSDDVS
jgi:hypothetical protein